jgi:hypothetical protein
MYGPHNTLHVDDLARNFALNPANGIKIKAYREDMCPAPEPQYNSLLNPKPLNPRLLRDVLCMYDNDRELQLLTRYLLHNRSLYPLFMLLSSSFLVGSRLVADVQQLGLAVSDV